MLITVFYSEEEGFLIILFCFLRSAVFRLIRLTFLAGGSWTVDNSIKWWFSCYRRYNSLSSYYIKSSGKATGTPHTCVLQQWYMREVYMFLLFTSSIYLWLGHILRGCYSIATTLENQGQQLEWFGRMKNIHNSFYNTHKSSLHIVSLSEILL